MNINPSIKSGDLGRLGGSRESGGGSDLLSQLGQRVSEALEKSRGTEAPQNSVDLKAVSNIMSNISGQPLAGMNHSFVV
jgi:hypothetical protein